MLVSNTPEYEAHMHRYVDYAALCTAAKASAEILSPRGILKGRRIQTANMAKKRGKTVWIESLEDERLISPVLWLDMTSLFFDKGFSLIQYLTDDSSRYDIRPHQTKALLWVAKLKDLFPERSVECFIRNFNKAIPVLRNLPAGIHPTITHDPDQSERELKYTLHLLTQTPTDLVFPKLLLVGGKGRNADPWNATLDAEVQSLRDDIRHVHRSSSGLDHELYRMQINLVNKLTCENIYDNLFAYEYSQLT